MQLALIFLPSTIDWWYRLLLELSMCTVYSYRRSILSFLMSRQFWFTAKTHPMWKTCSTILNGTIPKLDYSEELLGWILFWGKLEHLCPSNGDCVHAIPRFNEETRNILHHFMCVNALFSKSVFGIASTD